ncbi:MAG: DinB family protein [Bacteroidetes bacterium]|nr:DinB family protein [Bacteroidota bacterium]
MIEKPDASTFAPYFGKYIDMVGDKDPVRVLEAQVLDFKALMSEIPSEKEEFRYADGKWTVKEVIGHITDTERIMCFRALSIARGEAQPLPGFDQNNYVLSADFNRRSLLNIGHEFGAVREATIALFKSMNKNDLDRKGFANKHDVSVRALVYIIAGHHIHHERILREVYLADVL